MSISNLLVLAAVLLSGVAYYPILGWEPPAPDVEGPVESFFFEPAETSPQLAYALVALFLIRRRKRILAALATGEPSPAGPPVLASGVGLYLWSAYTSATDLTILSLIPTALGLALTQGGSRLMRAILRPTLLLLFAAPPPAALANQILYPLQLGTADLASWMLGALDIGVVQRADLLFSRDRVFQVIESCSGLRSMLTLAMAAVVYAELVDRQRLHAALLLVAAPPIAFLLNGARVVSIVLTAGEDSSQDHTFQGLVTILFGVLALHGVDRLLERWLPGGAGESAPEATRQDGDREPRRSRLPARAWALGAAALIASARFWLEPWAAPVAPVRWGVALPERWGDHRSSQLTIDRNFFGSVGFTRRLSRAYEAGDERIEILLGYDDLLSRHRNPISPRMALPGAGWEIESRDLIEVEGFPRPVTRVLARSGTKRTLSLAWYEGAGGLWSEIGRSIAALDRSPARRSRGITLVRLSTQVHPAPTGRLDAEQHLLRFATELRPMVLEAAERVAADGGSQTSFARSARRFW
jgi:exosortase